MATEQVVRLLGDAREMEPLSAFRKGPDSRREVIKVYIAKVRLRVVWSLPDEGAPVLKVCRLLDSLGSTRRLSRKRPSTTRSVNCRA